MPHRLILNVDDEDFIKMSYIKLETGYTLASQVRDVIKKHIHNYEKNNGEIKIKKVKP